MIDIVSLPDGAIALGDLGLYDSDVERAKNILSIQIGALEYEPTFGIDLKYFLDERYEFQDESFQSYCVQRLIDYGVNASSVFTEVQTLLQKWIFNIGDSPTGDGLVAR